MKSEYQEKAAKQVSFIDFGTFILLGWVSSIHYLVNLLQLPLLRQRLRRAGTPVLLIYFLKLPKVLSTVRIRTPTPPLRASPVARVGYVVG